MFYKCYYFISPPDTLPVAAPAAPAATLVTVLPAPEIFLLYAPAPVDYTIQLATVGIVK